ncbi:RsmE family RNA methyltransferase [bacterium]|nr:RsmE family RNA methyltransferase [bacterium]
MKSLAQIPYGDIVNKKFLHFSETDNYHVDDLELIIQESSIIKRISFVLRSRPDDEFVIIDRNGAYFSRITKISKSEVYCRILGTIVECPEPLKISFVLSPVKNISIYEEMVKYLVQLGISQIFFLKTSRTQFDVTDKKLNRLSHIARKHAEISKMTVCPEILKIDFDELKNWDQKFLLHTKTDQDIPIVDLKDACKRAIKKNSVFISGPEGGFSNSDIIKFKKLGNISCVVVKDVVMKAEAIPIYITSILHFLHSASSMSES